MGNTKSKDGLSETEQLCEALDSSKWDVAKKLVQRGGKSVKFRFETKNHGVKRTALYFACLRGAPVDLFAMLLQGADVDVNECNEEKDNVLQIAAREGHANLCKMLLDRGWKVNVQDQFAHSPLYYAAKNEHVEVVRLLLKHGAKLNKDQRGETAIDVCKNYDIKVLLGATANVHQELYQCVADSNYARASELLDAGADAAKYSDNTKRNAISLLAFRGEPVWLIKKMIETSSGVDVSNAPYLQEAVWSGNLEMVQYFVGAGSNLERTNENGHTALHTAYYLTHGPVAQQMEEITRFLIASGANETAKDSTGRTPAEIKGWGGKTKNG